MSPRGVVRRPACGLDGCYERVIGNFAILDGVGNRVQRLPVGLDLADRGSGLDTTEARRGRMKPVGQVVLTKTDAWVFMAIGRPIFGWDSLSYVVGFLDYLNRAMPSEAEFEASVRRLGAAGLITVSSKGFRQTRTSRGVIKRSGQVTGVITVMLDLMKEWDGLAVPEVARGFQFHLRPGEWERAQGEYEERMAKRIAKIKKRGMNRRPPPDKLRDP